MALRISNASPRRTTQTALHQTQPKYKLQTLTHRPSSTHSKGAQLQALVTPLGSCILHIQLHAPASYHIHINCYNCKVVRNGSFSGGTTVLDWTRRVQMTSVLPMNLSHLFHLTSIIPQDSTLRTATDGCYQFEQKGLCTQNIPCRVSPSFSITILFYRESGSQVPRKLQVVTQHIRDWDLLLVPYSLH